MKIHSIGTLLLFFISILWLQSAMAADVQKPKDELEPYINQILVILKQEKNTINQEEKVNRIMKVAQEGFDFQEMSKRVLGRQWKDLSPAEQDKFVTLFTQLLKYAYVTQIDKYNDQTVKFTKQRVRGKRAQVDTVVVGDGKEISVSYIMHLKDGHWRVYDVIAERISLIRNYLEQFQGILKKQTFEDLTKMMEKKISEFKQNPEKASAEIQKTKTSKP